MTIETIQGDLTAKGLKFGLVAARFNDYITHRLVDGAVETLQRHGAADKAITIVKVPGAFEIPIALDQMAQSGRYDALIAIGCVIRGATPHFEYVAGECARGMNQVALQYHVPVGLGVLTVDTLEQAIERAGSKAGNKGVDAALAAMEMASVCRRIQR